MKILAVSDKESPSLMQWIERSSDDLKPIDLIVSCGDLSASYLEFLSSSLGKEVVCVRGNHDPKKGWRAGAPSESRTFLEIPVYEDHSEGVQDIHGKLFIFKDWILMGFEGSLWYNGEGPQHHEEEMAKIVRLTEMKYLLQRGLDWLKGIKRKLIVISHAPVSGIHDGSDLCHRGFKCFHHLIEALDPVLWLHGHTAYESLVQNQVSVSERTTLLNAYEYRFIVLSQGCEPVISYRPSILREGAPR